MISNIPLEIGYKNNKTYWINYGGLCNAFRLWPHRFLIYIIIKMNKEVEIDDGMLIIDGKWTKQKIRNVLRDYLNKN